MRFDARSARCCCFALLLVGDARSAVLGVDVVIVNEAMIDDARGRVGARANGRSAYVPHVVNEKPNYVAEDRLGSYFLYNFERVDVAAFDDTFKATLRSRPGTTTQRLVLQDVPHGQRTAEDVVELTIRPRDPAERIAHASLIRLGITQRPGGERWWKGLVAFSGTQRLDHGIVLAAVEGGACVPDAATECTAGEEIAWTYQRPEAMAAQSYGLAKAKEFGVHHNQYVLDDAQNARLDPSKEYLISWIHDDGAWPSPSPPPGAPPPPPPPPAPPPPPSPPSPPSPPLPPPFPSLAHLGQPFLMLAMFAAVPLTILFVLFLLIFLLYDTFSGFVERVAGRSATFCEKARWYGRTLCGMVLTVVGWLLPLFSQPWAEEWLYNCFPDNHAEIWSITTALRSIAYLQDSITGGLVRWLIGSLDMPELEPIVPVIQLTLGLLLSVVTIYLAVRWANSLFELEIRRRVQSMPADEKPEPAAQPRQRETPAIPPDESADPMRDPMADPHWTWNRMEQRQGLYKPQMPQRHSSERVLL